MVTIQKPVTAADKQLDMADTLAPLAKDLASPAVEQSDVAEEIGNIIMVQPQVYAAITELQTYSKVVGDPEFGHQ